LSSPVAPSPSLLPVTPSPSTSLSPVALPPSSLS
jgi:hypothetical protein